MNDEASRGLSATAGLLVQIVNIQLVNLWLEVYAIDGCMVGGEQQSISF